MNTPIAHTSGSTYPVPVDELVPRAQALAARLGEIPSRNRLMSELRVGAPKAKAVREALEATASETADTDAEAGPARLHLVPDQNEPDTDAPGSGPAAKTGPAAEPNPVPTADRTHPVPSLDTEDEPHTEPDAQLVPDPLKQPLSGNSTPVVPPEVTPRVDPGPKIGPTPAQARVSGRSRVRSWPVLLLALPAFVAIWSGWVGLGSLTGFGIVHPLPGIWDSLQLNTAITLPIGVETYAAYALRVWVSGRVPARARRFAKYSAIGSLALGALGQVAYHLMAAADMQQAPWWITTAVSCLPVAVLGMGAALTHLLHADDNPHDPHDQHEEVAR